MKREEQIIEASHNYSKTLNKNEAFDYKDMKCAFEEGAMWSDKNTNPQNIAEYLYKEKGYPISLNGEISTFEETMKTVQAYNAYKEKQLIEKACNWLREQKEMIGISFQEDFIERFKIAMEE